MLASKYEEIYHPLVLDFANLTPNLTGERLMEWEFRIWQDLDYKVSFPTALTFLRLYSVDGPLERNEYYLSRYLAELSCLESRVLLYVPSVVAAGCVYLARHMLGEDPIWVKSGIDVPD